MDRHTCVLRPPAALVKRLWYIYIASPEAPNNPPGSQLPRICAQRTNNIYNIINVLTFSPLTGGCSEGPDAFRFFFKHHLLRGFRLPHRHSRLRFGSPWAGPINAALNRLKLATAISVRCNLKLVCLFGLSLPLPVFGRIFLFSSPTWP